MADKELELIIKFTGKISGELDASLNKLKSTIENTVKTGTEPLTKSVNQLTQAKKKATKATDEQHTAIGRLSKQFDSLFGNIGAVIKAQLRWYSTQTLIFGIVNSVKEAANSYKELQQEVKNVAAITGATAAEEKVLMDAAREAGKTTAIAAHEASDAMLMLAQAGYSAGESAQALIPITKTMTVTGDSAVTVVDLLTTAMSTWHKTTADSYDILNELVKGMDATKLTMGDMKTAFSLTAGVAEIANFSMLDFISTLGYLKDRGEKAGTAARGLRQILLQLGKTAQDPSSALSKRFNELSISLEKVNPLTNDFNDILKVLEVNGFTAADAMRYLPANASETMIRMLGASEAIKKYNENIKNAPELNAKFNKSMEGIQNQLSKLKNRFMDLYYTIFEDYGQNIQNFINQLGQLITVFGIFLRDTPATKAELKELGNEFRSIAAIINGVYWAFAQFVNGFITGFKVIIDASTWWIGHISDTFSQAGENITALWAYLKSDRTQRDWEDFKMTIEGIDLKYNQQAADRNRDFWVELEKDTRSGWEKILKLNEDLAKKNQVLLGMEEPTVAGKGKKEKTQEDLIGKSIEEATVRARKKALEAKIEAARIAADLVAGISAAYAGMSKEQIEQQIKTYEALGQYDEKYVEAKLALYIKYLMAETSLTNKEIKNSQLVADKKKEIEAEAIDSIIDKERKKSDVINKIHEKDVLMRAAKANQRKKEAEEVAQAEIDAAETFIGRLKALLEKDDLTKPFQKWADFAKAQIDSVSNQISDAFADFIVEGKNLQDAFEQIWKNIAKSLIRELTNQAIKEIILTFFRSIKTAAAADAGGEISWWWGLIKAVIGGIGSYFGGGGGGGGGSVEKIEVHKGGYVGDVVKSFHSGGLNANETMAKLRTDEFVMGPLATKEIGVDSLNEMNRTGSVPQEQQPVTVQVINVTDPNDIPKYLTENPNVILNIIARDKRYGGQMKEIVANR